MWEECDNVLDTRDISRDRRYGPRACMSPLGRVRERPDTEIWFGFIGFTCHMEFPGRVSYPPDLRFSGTRFSAGRDRIQTEDYSA